MGNGAWDAEAERAAQAAVCSWRSSGSRSTGFRIDASQAESQSTRMRPQQGGLVVEMAQEDQAVQPIDREPFWQVASAYAGRNKSGQPGAPCGNSS